MSVLSIGQIVYDLIVELDGFPFENRKYSVDHFIETGGGPASNAAFLLAKWGTNTSLCGRVGHDLYGDRILSEFHAVKADTSLIKVINGAETSLSLVLVNKKNGSRTIINRKNKDSDINVDFDSVQNYPKIILFDGHELGASLAAKLAFPDAVTVLDAGSVRIGTLELAPLSDYFICSEKFALEYCNIENLDISKDTHKVFHKLKGLTSGKIAVTLGERGLIYETEEGAVHMSAFSTDAVDTTGAGDIFHGAFTYGLLQGFPFEENLKFASLTSAISVEKPGGRSSIPELSEVIKKFKKLTGSDIFEVSIPFI
jgi:sugar/nucleoside kinase (ribokinase family)